MASLMISTAELEDSDMYMDHFSQSCVDDSIDEVDCSSASLSMLETSGTLGGFVLFILNCCTELFHVQLGKKPLRKLEQKPSGRKKR